MNKQEVIAFEIEKTDLEYVLGFLADAISRMNQSQAFLKCVVSMIGMAIHENEEPVQDPDADKDCKILKFPCSDKSASNESADNKPDSMPAESGASSAEEEEDDEAESLAIELLKAVFCALADLIENDE